MIQRRASELAYIAHRWIARFERLARDLRMFPLSEQVGVDRQGDVGVGMAELATHEHDIEPLRDQQTRVAGAVAMERQATVPPSPGS
jgi:hypothetical protein